MRGGAAAIRGFYVQALVCIADSFVTGEAWEFVQFEPSGTLDSVDIVWHYAGYSRAVQVKSSENQISKSDIEAWAKELESRKLADRVEFRVIGPCSQGALTVRNVGKIDVAPIEPLNMDSLKCKATHLISMGFFRRFGIGVHPEAAHLMCDGLVGRLFDLGITGRRIGRDELWLMLFSWAKTIAPESVKRRSAIDCGGGLIQMEDCTITAINASAIQNSGGTIAMNRGNATVINGEIVTQTSGKTSLNRTNLICENPSRTDGR